MKQTTTLLPPRLREPAACNRLLVSGLLALVLFSGASRANPLDGVTPPSHEKIRQAINAAKEADKAKESQKDQASSKLDSALNEFIEGTNKSLKSGAGSAILRTKGSNLVQVYITTKNTSETTLQAVRDLGIEIELVVPSLNKIQAWSSADALQELVKLNTVKSVTRPHYATTKAGSKTTQGDAILRANELRKLGITGKGIKVGIVSDGANSWQTARNSGDLPQTVTVYGSCSTRSADASICSPALTCNEGTAMAEIIHDIAPKAELAVAAVGTSLEFISQINKLANTFKANIIVDDLGFYAEPYFADGDIALAVAALPADVLYVSAAGNSAASHYERNYRKYPADTTIHDFGTQEGAGIDETLGFITAPDRGTVALLQWDESYNNPSSDYDLYIFDINGNITHSSAFDSSQALEGVCVPNTGSSDQVHFAVVDKYSGSTRRLEMFFLGASAIEYEIPNGSIFGHPGVSRAVAVGTINAGSNTSAFYSSRGPAQRNRAKPDLTGVDGVSVTGAGGFPSTFFGTSAAAPHVAGVAALLMSASKKNTSDAVRQAMFNTATDLGSSGRDSIYGYGRVNAEAAITQLDVNLGNASMGSLLLLLLDEETE